MPPGKKLFLKGVKVGHATDQVAAEYSVGDQTGDMTSFTRPSVGEPVETTGVAPVVEAAPGIRLPAAKAPAGPKAPGAPAPKAAPRAPAAPAPTAAAPKGPPPDFSKFGPALPYAIEIAGTEAANPYKLKGPASQVFPLQTRMGFQQQILKVFSEFVQIPEFGKEPDFDACKKLGAGAAGQVEMYEYQKFVREYTRQSTPYRGLLVYHGLGSGKTCSAIAAAEALFSVNRKKIIVMTPSSLRYNFIREVSFCGFRHYRLQNAWEELSLTGPDAPMVKLFATEILGLPDSFLRRAARIWAPNFDAPPNFNALGDTERREITAQLEVQISNRITFVNYNGVTASRLKAIACAPPDADGYGFFDNATIIVDEIHNLTRLMQGTIEPYLTSIPGLKGRKVPLELMTPGRWEPALCKKTTDPRKPYQTNYKRGYLFYRLLAGARNSKLIGLSGTPLINFPEEIAILTNLIGGYIHTCSFVATPGTEANAVAVKAILAQSPYVDFEEVELLGTNMNILFTVLPEGLTKAKDAQGALGVQRVAPGTVTPTIQETAASIVAAATAGGRMRVIQGPEYKSEPLLPPVGDDFRTLFLDGTKLKNTVVLRKRLQGLVSYYRGSKKELMPAVTVDTVINVPFTPYSQLEYQRIRAEELKIQAEKQKKAPAGAIPGVTGSAANLWADIYELTKLKQTNSYRMASRQACNFAFPEGIVRPRPRNAEDAVAEIGGEAEIITEGGAEGEGEGGESSGPVLKGELDAAGAEAAAAEAEAAAEDRAIDEGTLRDALEEVRAAGAGVEADAAEAEAEAEAEAAATDTVLVGEIAPATVEGELVPAAAAVAVGAPAGAVGAPAKKTLTGAQLQMQQQAKLKETCKKGLLAGEKYEVATKRAKDCLRIFANTKLRLFGPGMSAAQKLKDGEKPDPMRLMKYSPKFATILTKIYDAPGSSLVYSQFLDMEGIGIFSTILDINDFHRIEIIGDEGNLRFSPASILHLKKGPGANRYLTFTGAKGSAGSVRNMALKVFNARYSEEAAEAASEATSEATGATGALGPVGRFTDLPPEMSAILVEAGFKGNTLGELCRVFCITAAGAEGLSLKNVRRVHIMEPFWNHVRTDQVKGRAVRICSHIDLEYSADPVLNQRTVEVYTYCSVFDPQAMSKDSAFPKIDANIISSDGLKAEDAMAMGFTVPAGMTEYVITSDQHLLQLSERKKKVLQSIQDLMKTSAVDCKINIYENDEEGLGCITLPGTPQQYAFHPNLKKDIAETSTRFPEGSVVAETAGPGAPLALDLGLEGVDAVGAPVEVGAVVAAPVAVVAAQAQPKKMIQAREIFVDKVPYLAIPKLERGQTVPLVYDVYARGDLKRTRKIGVTLANSDGNPSSEVEFL